MTCNEGGGGFEVGEDVFIALDDKEVYPGVGVSPKLMMSRIGGHEV